jgi:hypothetical protein
MGTLTIAALTLGVGTLALAPATVAATGKTVTESASTDSFMDFPGTNGWHFVLFASQQRKSRLNVSILGRKRRDESVDYSVHGRVTKDGTIVAKLPGIGRIAVDFEPTQRTITSSPAKGCEAEGKASSRRGWFRGTIEIHGEGGYTSVARTSAHGEVNSFPANTCPKPAAPHVTKAQEKASYPPAVLLAGRRFKDGRLQFQAVNLEGWTSRSGGAVEPITQFAATYEHHRDGVWVTASNSVDGVGSNFLSTATEGSPTDATLEPPAPFSGSATFHLESPKKSSWTGDLGVQVPTLGEVSLVASRTWSLLCAQSDCTETGPAHFGFSFSWSESNGSGTFGSIVVIDGTR